ncbi:phosphotransferase [uncultured Fibrobacter sp.]|uniref:phosphotransferase n=1 Tax=uncultured Fibrobacter sp. TaxID=261512 RepID=UPI0025D4BD1E|nr:phosphotransferase [uncultured Fibrobacter sp.]
MQDFELLQSLLGTDSIFGINFGTPSPDQKKSILGYDGEGRCFFAKLSRKENAQKLSSNEIFVYQKLADSGLVPKLFDCKITDDYVFLKTECVEGNHIHEQVSNDEILKILETLRVCHYDERLKADGLKTCFSHGDFCPWNMLESEGRLKIIDWEMAGERSLGHDLFTYIFQTAFLIRREESFENVMQKNRTLIDSYFESACVNDWEPYFKDFALLKVDEFTRKQDSYMLARYKDALNAKF